MRNHRIPASSVHSVGRHDDRVATLASLYKIPATRWLDDPDPALAVEGSQACCIAVEPRDPRRVRTVARQARIR